jgi:putative phosphoesterase
MTTVGIIADTHISPARRRILPAALLEHFASVDLILHAGDLTARSVLDALGQLAPVFAVRGNNDSPSLGLPLKQRIVVEDVVIGLCHGDVGAQERIKPLPNLRGNGGTAANALSQFEHEDDVRCIVFGHSHNPVIHLVQVHGRAVTLFNPGSPTDKRWGTHYGYGLMRIDGAQMETELFTWE